MANVKKRGKKWMVHFQVFKIRKARTFNTKSEAEAFKREVLLRKIEQQIDLKVIESMSIGSAIDQYLNTVTPKKELRTREVDGFTLSKFKLAYGNCSVQEVRLHQLESYQMQLISQNLKASSVNRKFNVIRHFFRKCVEWRYCSESPTLNLTKLKESIVIRSPLSSEIVDRITKSLPVWAARAFYFAAKTGVRRGSLCSLTWDCVSFENNSFKVVSKKGGKINKIIDLPMTVDIQSLFLELWNEKRTYKFDSDYVELVRR